MIDEKVSYLIEIYGVVQGIGFRPYIYKKAKEYNISGWVNNCDSSVLIDLEGEKESVKNFLIDVVKKPPDLANIKKVKASRKNTSEYNDFSIKSSTSGNTRLKFVLPDVSTCDECLKDILDENSKRYRYPFTNCTLCGPRYSIIKKLPYDRCNTTMDNFKMCNYCEDEYKNPETRRFHAQPTCCIECGPRLVLTDKYGEKIKCYDEIKECARLLNEGKVLGIKGIGGFHIVCSAFNKNAISTVRRKKNRLDKPLALMMKNIDEVKKFCYVSEEEEKVLKGKERPIVLLNKIYENNKKNSSLIGGLSIGEVQRECLKNADRAGEKSKKYGIMLPYNPIHYLLFEEGVPPLVMTSGNVSGKNIEYTNKGALDNISDIVDYFLLNNRDINTPIDDSVVKVLEDKLMVSRLGRGYAPYFLERKIKSNILACGGEDKNTVSFSMNGVVHVSQYMGDLKEVGVYEEYKKSIENLKRIFEFEQEVVCFDMHPNYMSTLYAESINSFNVRKVAVQHHHAHMASCMLEHDILDDVIGIVYDGTGFGLDGNVWGGEFFVGNRKEVKRVGYYKYATIQGGDSAQRDIWKIGVSYLKMLEDEELMEFGMNRISEFIGESTCIENLCSAIEYNINCYKTSSVGRLYDAVSSILGVREKISYDGQGAIELEGILKENVWEYYEYSIVKKGEYNIIDYTLILKGILKDIMFGKEESYISAKFHNTLVKVTVDMACALREKNNINKVVLSGGVFENEYLIKNTWNALSNKGFEVFFNEKIPINDGGISFGQVAVADACIEENNRS